MFHPMSRLIRMVGSKMILSIIFIVSLLLMVACSSQSATKSNTSEGKKADAPSVNGKEGSASTEYDKIVEAAKKEGELIWWGTNPRASTLKKLEAAFEKRFGFDIKVTQVNISAKDIPTRIVAEASSGRGTADAIWGTMENFMLLEDRGILKPYPWVDVFGKEFPKIKEMVDNIPDPLKGKGLEYYHLVDGIIYNTKNMKESDVPKTYKDLLDPKFKGKIAISMDSTGFYNLIFAMKEGELKELMKGVMNNQPILAKGSPEVVEMVATGQVLFGIGALSSGEAKRDTGAPVGLSLLDPTPVKQTMVYSPQNAPHRNLALLWSAWFATEGKPIYAEEGRVVVWPGSGSDLEKIISKNNIKTISAKNASEFNQADDMRKVLSEIITNWK